ncbi:hypothetical protein [Methylovorus sp. MP688]|uniref:hypothetical protein n=1 Tax=Methylovorus sp. (strain MP688) TaxID=887061 RepID=UPI0011D0FAF0|nr:hypothetical protein [Methylovorus sp. MP688]
MNPDILLGVFQNRFFINTNRVRRIIEPSKIENTILEILVGIENNRPALLIRSKIMPIQIAMTGEPAALHK